MAATTHVHLSTLLVLVIAMATTVNSQVQTIITRMDGGPLKECITDPPQDINYTCSNDDASNKDINWRIGTYQIVDKRIFRDFGVVIEYDGVDDPPMMLQIPTSDPMKSEHGTTFLFDNFIEDPMLSDNPLVTIDNINPVVTIDCVTVENSLILRPSVNSITLYKGVPPVELPVWQVTSCNDDGTLTLSISYETISQNDICVPGTINYTLSLTGGGDGSYVFDSLNVEVDVNINSVIYATMIACVGDYCSERTTHLSTNISCSQSPVIEACDDGSNKQTIINCNLLSGASNSWSCEYDDDDSIVDVYDATNKPLRYMCPDDVSPTTTTTTTTDDDDCLLILVVPAVFAFILGLVIPIVIFLIRACYVYKSGNQEK